MCTLFSSPIKQSWDQNSILECVHAILWGSGSPKDGGYPPASDSGGDDPHLPSLPPSWGRQTQSAPGVCCTHMCIDLMQLMSSPHIMKHEIDSGRKTEYYVAILSGKNGRGLWSLSTAEQFANSFLTSAGSDFTFTPRMHKVSTGPNAQQSEQAYLHASLMQWARQVVAVLKLHRPWSSLPLKMAV